MNKNPTDATVCRYLFTTKLLYMFRVSHPSLRVLKTVPATSGTGHTTCTATHLQCGLIGTECCDTRNMWSSFAANKYLLTVASVGFLFTLVPLLNCSLGVWDMYRRRMMHERPLKYTKQTYTKNDLMGDPRLQGNIMWRMA